MDDVRLVQASIVAILGGIVGLGFLYVRRIERGPVPRYWSWAWFAFFVSLLTLAFPHWPAQIVAHAMGTGFPTLLLAGAIAFVGRPVPARLAQFGLVIILGLLSVSAVLSPASTGLLKLLQQVIE